MIFRTKGIILKRRNFGEADKILTILTPGRSKIEVIAKGVRKIASRLGGHLEIFYEVDLELTEGKTWYVLTGAETKNRFLLGDNLDLLERASYASQLVLRLSQGEQEGLAVYNLFKDYLSLLSTRNSLALLQFEWRLLLAGGYRPKLTSCTVCSGDLDKDNLGLSASAGGAVCSVCQIKNTSLKISENTFKVLRLFENSSLSIASKFSGGSVNVVELKKVNKIFWEYYLDYSLK